MIPTAEKPGELDFADEELIRLLLAMAGQGPESPLQGALKALCENVQRGGLCLPVSELPQAAAFAAEAAGGGYDAVLAGPDGAKPLVLWNGRLYFHRHFHAEKSLADGLRRLLGAGPFSLEPGATQVFRELAEKHAPFRLAPKQEEALLAAARERVFLLSGGPGTGKTTLTALLLRGLLRLRSLDPARLRLCAPTGRAARRLRESLETGGLDLPVETLHGLLGYHPPTGRFARCEHHPLDADAVLVDEASMADVFLLSALAKALPTGCALILVGDADQLPSVAAGAVLSELRPDALGSPIPAVVLDRGHRSGRGVTELAAAVNAGDADAALRLLGEGLAAEPLPRFLEAHARELFFTLRAEGHTYAEWLERLRAGAAEPDVLPSLARLLESARLLTFARHGPRGCERINRLLRGRLARLDPEAVPRAPGFHGAPLLITRNDAATGLANGEIGIWLRDGSGNLAAHFPRPGRWLSLPAAFLPPQEPAFAVTVHKSQGSECDRARIVLPEPGHPLLARETLYTAVTRARESVQVHAAESAFREAVRNRLLRPGGLRDYFAPAA